VPYLLGIAAHQAPEGLITEEQTRQRRHALDPKQGLQAIEQEIRDDRHHLALDCRALDVAQLLTHPQLLQDIEEVVQQRAFVQLVDSIDHRLPLQAPRYPCVAAVSDLPTQALGQILCNLCSCLCHRPPPSVDSFSPSREKWARDQAFCLSPNFSQDADFWT
jgi:hypothetical protein